MADRSGVGPGFVIFTICWLAFQAFVMFKIAAAVEESGSLAVMLAWAVSGMVLVLAYMGVLLAAAVVMEKAGHSWKRDQRTEDDDGSRSADGRTPGKGEV
ncbi:hypothetical protein [Nonomuraea fuscirosea]|uniref:hypothetical protein n=1 Tax=Nonomuraea fuscirosea TaxID=1291556 RepID=UPI0033CF1C4E